MATLRLLNPLSHLVLLEGDLKSTRTGWPGKPVARLPPPCSPTISTDSDDTAQSAAWQLLPSVCHSQLDGEAVVPGDTQASGQGSLVPAQEAGLALTSGRPHLSPKPGKPAAVGVAPE